MFDLKNCNVKWHSRQVINDPRMCSVALGIRTEGSSDQAYSHFLNSDFCAYLWGDIGFLIIIPPDFELKFFINE